jgi:hypothetical protein|tara:strand:+ start:41 stop:478 length:438 start_codon:yes stop_codon:yes gene_type:complete
MENVLITNWNKGTNTKFVINEKTNKSESLITKCIKSLNKEISELKGRENLTLKQIERTINGKVKEQDELRGWKFKGNGDVQLLVRVKGVIVNLTGNKNESFDVTNPTREIVLKELKKLKSEIENNCTNEILLKNNKNSNVLKVLK